MTRRSRKFRKVLSAALATISLAALVWIWRAPRFHPSVASGPAWLVKWTQGHGQPPGDFRSIWCPIDASGAEVTIAPNDTSLINRAIIVTEEERKKPQWAIRHRGIELSTRPECWQPWNGPGTQEERLRLEQLAALETEWRLQTPGLDSRVEIATGTAQDGAPQIVATLSGNGETRRYTYCLSLSTPDAVSIVPIEYAYRSTMTDAGKDAKLVTIRLIEYSAKIAASFVLFVVCTNALILGKWRRVAPTRH